MEKKLYLYNTASRKKELFESSDSTVGLYCCGPTVYNYAHIGNLRTYVFEDILKRVLLSLDFTVKHVVNITDVGHLTSDADTGEDKMEKGAKREGKSVWDIAEYYTEKFMENIHDLNILEADVWPKATDHIQEMIDLVVKLEENGVTYRTSDGIYFDTTKFPAYCDFARLDPNSLRAGSRIDMGEKKNPTDFALWKFSPEDEKRQMEWDSPWGVGFPGWHIECSAMSLKYLQQPIDIHCGGIDHIRIHHTNEIAQVEAAHGEQFVRVWLHGEFLVMDKGKMAKSKGEFITLNTLKDRKIEPLAYKLFCYTAHYRSPLNFSWESLSNAENSLKNLRSLVLKETADGEGEISEEKLEEILESFWTALYDDLNIPQAIAALWDILHKSVEKKKAVEKTDAILALDLFSVEPEKVVVTSSKGTDPHIKIISSSTIPEALIDEITGIVKERKTARKEKDFSKADSLRDKLESMNVEVKDMPDDTTECHISGE
jgi:cysteinyl-tRNA synthetase